MSIYVGVDVGGTTSTIAIGDEARNVIRISSQFPTRSLVGPEATVADIVQQIAIELAAAGRSVDELHAVCLATPGPATLDGVLMQTPNLDPSKWNRCPIRKMLQAAVTKSLKAVEVAYIGDGQAAAVGEYCIRTERIHWDQLPPIPKPNQGGSEIDSLFFVAVGTGLGGGEVRAGLGVQGAQGRAGHAGHMLLPPFAFRYPHDQQLLVGNSMCTAESAISLTALTHQLGYRLTLPHWADHPLNQQDCSLRDKAKQLRELAAESDPLAVELFEDQAKALGLVMLTINYMGDYDCLVIGGGVCEMSRGMRARYLDLVRESYEKHALDGFRKYEHIGFSVCGDNASVIGALAQSYGV
ncbi:Fructokinase [Rubripirellula amarantea]|uniref:Fructokinase n=1 Tax=Rubripirellula amarantea TaxID=2527999 RepID=A0A5C5WHT6_9BACT|nr:ROK family protein [Rubripirellula amarantea]TWT50374.1 Fructokinase [Rubripirellula amarantea]